MPRKEKKLGGFEPPTAEKGFSSENPQTPEFPKTSPTPAPLPTIGSRRETDIDPVTGERTTRLATAAGRTAAVTGETALQLTTSPLGRQQITPQFLEQLALQQFIRGKTIEAAALTNPQAFAQAQQLGQLQQVPETQPVGFGAKAKEALRSPKVKAGITGGAAAGALAGSPIPGLGTAIGGAVGAAGGGAVA